MTESLTIRPPSAVMALSREQRDTLKNTICKELTDSELDLFISFCKSRNFDPLGKFVAPFKSGGKMSMVTYIDAKRAVAHRSGLFDGMDGPFYCGEDGAWKDVWLAKTRPVACKVVVYRRNCSHPFTAILLASEYKGGAVAGQMPVHMLGKATESLALSKAFPEDLGQLYTDDEIPDARGAVASLSAEPASPKPTASAGRLSLAAVTKQYPDAIEGVYTEAPPEAPAEPASEPYEFRPTEPEAPAYADPLDVLKALKALQSVGITSSDDLYAIFGGNPETMEIDVDHTPVSALEYAREAYRKRAPKKAKTA